MRQQKRLLILLPSDFVDTKKEMTEVLERLLKVFPECTGEKMIWSREREPAWRVLVGTILSQRNKDESTEIAAYNLFGKYPTLKKLAAAPVKDIEKLVFITGPYRQKASNIKKTTNILLKKYKGKVPKTYDELVAMPGVGHKTADCTLLYGHGIPIIPVDTHVHHASNMFGWVKTKTPEKTRHELHKLVPKKYWAVYNCIFVTLGRATFYKRDRLKKYLGAKLYNKYSKRKSFKEGTKA